MRNDANLKNVPVEAVRALDILEELFEGQLAGVYLYGSAMLGGLRADSDVDILAILRRGLPEAARRELTGRLMRISGVRAGARPLEVTVIRQGDVVPWRFPPRCEYLYGEWLRGQFEAGAFPEPAESPDLAVLLWQARSHSLALIGPEAADVLEPVPPADVRRAIGRSLPELMEGLKGDERNVLLTLARMWRTAATGEIRSKDAAAAWAIPRLPEGRAALLETARRAYLGECADRWEGLEADTAALAAFMEGAIEHLLESGE